MNFHYLICKEPLSGPSMVTCRMSSSKDCLYKSSLTGQIPASLFKKIKRMKKIESEQKHRKYKNFQFISPTFNIYHISIVNCITHLAFLSFSFLSNCSCKVMTSNLEEGTFDTFCIQTPLSSTHSLSYNPLFIIYNMIN